VLFAGFNERRYTGGKSVFSFPLKNLGVLRVSAVHFILEGLQHEIEIGAASHRH
jgi:hypothetical protein